MPFVTGRGSRESADTLLLPDYGKPPKKDGESRGFTITFILDSVLHAFAMRQTLTQQRTRSMGNNTEQTT